MSKRAKSNLLILLAAFIWGTAFLAQKEGGSIGTFTFNGIRFIIGGLFLLPVIKIRDAKRARDTSIKAAAADGAPEDDMPDLADYNWNRTVLIGGMILGVILFAASSVQQYGIQFTTLGKAGFITALYSVLVPVLSVFIGKKVRWLTWIGVALGVAGLYLLSMYGETLSLSYGDAFMLASAFLFALQIMVIDHFSPKTDGVKLSCVEFFTVGAVSMPLMFIFESPDIAEILSAWIPVIYAGVLSSGVAYTLQIVGQKYAEPTQAALIMCLESVFSLLTGFVVLGERLAVHEYAGVLLIFAAIVLSQIPERGLRAE